MYAPALAAGEAKCAWPAGLNRPSAAGEADAALLAGYWYAERRDPACAIPWFRRAAAASVHRVEAHYNLGVALLETGETAAAAATLDQALRLAPGDPQVYAAWEAAHRQALEVAAPAAQALARRGDWPKAAGAWRDFLRASPGAVGAQYQLALALTALGQYAEAEGHLREALRRLPGNPDLLTALGMSLVRQKRAADAVAVFRQVEQRRPHSALARLNTAVALADAAQLEAAAEKFREAIAADANLLEAHRQLGRVLLQLRRLDEARNANLRALALKGDDAVTLRQLGLLENLAGNHQEAAHWYGRAVAAGAADADTLFKYAKELLETGRKEEAVAQLRLAVERDPGGRQALYLLMRVLSKENPEEAQQLGARLRATRQAEMTATRARLLNNAALQAAHRQDWPQAVTQLREALAACGDCTDRGTLHRNLGLVLAQAGQIGQARGELEHALRLDANDRDAALALEILAKTSPPAPPPK